MAPNKELAPIDVTPGSERKVWWLCKNGHSWKSTVGSRTRGTGCPECFQEKRGDLVRKASVRLRGSLADKHPEIAKQWHPTKNGDLTAKDVASGSQLAVWWKCRKNHEWRTSVANRTAGTSCPICIKNARGEISKKAALKRSGSLAESNSWLVREWHPRKNKGLAPSDITPQSHKKVWWVCSRGHEWQATIAHRTNGQGCPHCNPQISRIEIRIYCELKSIFDEVKLSAKFDGTECDVYLPKHKVGIEIDGYPWHKDREEKDRQKSVFFHKKGITLLRVRDKRLKQISQTDIFYSSREKYLLAVKKIFGWLLNNISLSQQDQKKILDYLKVTRFQATEEYWKTISRLPGPEPEKSLVYVFPKVAKEWHFEKNKPLDPIMVHPKSGLKVWWKCEKGHEWQAKVDNRTIGRRGCPFCAGKKVSNENSLAIKNPDLAKEWHPTKNGGLTPFNVTSGSGRKVWWMCSKGHEWQVRVDSRTSFLTGCPKCRYEHRGSK